MPIYTPVFTDNFTRANESPLNATNWTQNTGGYGQLAVLSDVCVDATGGYALGGGGELVNVVLSNDQYIEMTLGTVTSSNSLPSNFAPGVRTNSTVTSGYEIDLVCTVGGNAFIELYDANTGFALAPVYQPGRSFQTGDVVRLEALGTALTVKFNGVTVITATDSAYTSGSAFYFVLESVTPSDTTISLFTAGNITSSPSGTPGSLGMMGCGT